MGLPRARLAQDVPVRRPLLLGEVDGLPAPQAQESAPGRQADEGVARRPPGDVLHHVDGSLREPGVLHAEVGTGDAGDDLVAPQHDHVAVGQDQGHSEERGDPGRSQGVTDDPSARRKVVRQRRKEVRIHEVAVHDWDPRVAPREPGLPPVAQLQGQQERARERQEALPERDGNFLRAGHDEPVASPRLGRGSVPVPALRLHDDLYFFFRSPEPGASKPGPFWMTSLLRL